MVDIFHQSVEVTIWLLTHPRKHIFNFWVALQADLPERMGDMADPRLTGQELLHAVREADF